MLSVALSLALAAEPDALASLLERAAALACAPDGGVPSVCARVKAFQAAKPADAKKPLFTIGTFEEDGVQFQLLELSAEGATAGLLRPDDHAEREHFLAIIEELRKGQRKDPLLLAVAKDVKGLPHFPTAKKEGSLFFQVQAPLGGHWLRRAQGKLLMLSFNGDTHHPALRFSEFPDDRK